MQRKTANGTLAVMNSSRRRYGVGAAEVVVALVLLVVVALIVLMALPRGRETARINGCQRNLMHPALWLWGYWECSPT